MLGAPTINVEVTNSQLDQIIEDSVQLMQKWNSGDGNYLDYIVFTTSAGVSVYDFANDPALSATYVDVLNVVDLNLSFGIDGINTLFSPSHILLQENGSANSLLGSRIVTGNYQPGLELTSYQTAMMYLQDIQMLLGKNYQVNWIPNSMKLVVTPTPMEVMSGLLRVYKKETAENLYNDELVKNICLAKTKILWGGALRKYAIQMPGGGTVLGSELVQEGKDELDYYRTEIRLESEPIDIFIG
jgi:hypothetical protein